MMQLCFPQLFYFIFYCKKTIHVILVELLEDPLNIFFLNSDKQQNILLCHVICFLLYAWLVLSYVVISFIYFFFSNKKKCDPILYKILGWPLSWVLSTSRGVSKLE